MGAAGGLTAAADFGGAALQLPGRGVPTVTARCVPARPGLPVRLIAEVMDIVTGGPFSSVSPGPAAERRLWEAAAGTQVAALMAVPLHIGGARGCLLAARKSRQRFSKADATALGGMATAIARLVAEVDSEISEIRRTITEELHDGLGQTITGLLLGMTQLVDLSRGGEQRSEVRELHVLCGKALRQLRKSLRLAAFREPARPVKYENIRGVVEALIASGIDVSLQTDPRLRSLPPEIGDCLYRVAREVLLNIQRHAEARRVRIAIARCGPSIELTITDDGIGMRVRRSRRRLGVGVGMGLELLRRQLAQMGGRLDVDDLRGDGTRVTASIPWTERRGPG